MPSFAKLYENMLASKDVNKDTPVSDSAMEVIKAGMNIDEDFWNNFITIIGNADGVADLFDIPKTSVTSWASKIQKAIDNAKGDQSEKGKQEQIPTGDLKIGEPKVADTQPADLNPTP